ncbi:LacI family DNA-binding transcriptional regulator [Nocardia sp. CA-128927]|uniref:LacI family DNA-binding transcriptional regulator n=1 Tax=Nocardia sp. CA-128927 TaxID=3239975 RepID=UPI003D99253B
MRQWHSSTKRPVVLLNSADPGDRQATMSVRSDQHAAVDLAVRHLVDAGHRRLAMVIAPPDKSPDPERWQHFQLLSEQLGFTATAVITELSADAARVAVAAELRRASEVRPTAFIANSDYIAHAVYLAAADCGLLVPQDISVIGHDDLPTSASLSPPLTTIGVNRREIGERAAALLISTLDGPPPTARDVIVAVDLRVRSSTAPRPS